MHKAKRFLVLEIEDNLVKTALIENLKGNISIKGIGSFSKAKNKIAAGLKRLQWYRWYRKNTIILIPSKKAMIRYLELPSHDRKELNDMINFQLPRYLPYNLGDIIFDFKVVQKKKEGYSKVMVACIQNKFFKEILEIIPQLEDNLHSVVLCGESGVNFLHAFQKDKKNVRALVDISSEEADLSIFDSTGTLFMRSLKTSFFIHEKNWPKGFEELEKTFIAFSREFSEKTIESIVITGARDYTSGFYDFLKKHSHHPVELFNSFDHVQCHKDTMERFNNLSFHSIIGAGVDAEKRRINLIPKESLSKKERRVKKRSRIHTLLLAMVIISQLFFILYKEIDKKKVYMNYLRAEIRKTESKAKVIESKENKTSLIKAQLDMEGSSLDILREVYSIIPKDISINILIFEKGNSLNIRGTARTMAEVFNLIPHLEKSPYFDRVISEGTKMRKLKGSVVADFQIRALLKENRE